MSGKQNQQHGTQIEAIKMRRVADEYASVKFNLESLRRLPVEARSSCR